MTQKLSKTSIVLLAVLAVLCLALAMLPMGKVNATTTEVGTIDELIAAVGTAAVYNTPAEIKLTQDVYYGTAESPEDTALEIPAQMYIEQMGKTYTVPEITIDLNGNTLYMYTTSNANFGISNSSFTIKNGKIVAQSTTRMAIFGKATPTPTEVDAVKVTVQDVEITYTATGSGPSVLFANNSKVSVSLNGVSYETNVDIARTGYAIDYDSVFHGETLQDKINLTNVYSTITLDRNYNESIVIPAGRGLTIDLGGHTLTNETGKHTVENYGTLTIKGDGKVDNVSHGCAAVLNREGGTLTLAGGTYTRSAEFGKTNTYYVLQNLGKMTIGSDNDSTVTVYAGSDTNAARTLVESSLVTTGYYNPADDKHETDDPVLTINGGKFYGGKITVKCDEKGTLNVTGGEFFASNEEDGSNDAIQGWNVVTVSGGTFHGPVSSWSYTSGGSLVSGNVTITGGEFLGAVDSYHYDTSTGFSHPKDDGLTVSGGTFASLIRSCHLEVDGSSAVLVKTDSGYEVLSPTSAEAAKYVVFVQDGDVRLGYEGEEQALAAMNGKEAYVLKENVYYAYATLAEAVEAAVEGDTVTLLKDVNVKDNGSSNGALYVTKSITIDGGRGTTAEKKGFAIAGTGNDAKRVIKIQATNGTVEVTLKNLVVESYFGNSAAMPVVTSGGNVTLVLDNVKIVADGGGNSQALTIGGASNQGEFVNVTVMDSELITNNAGYPIIVFNPVKMTITDSILSGYTGIYFKGYYKPNGELTNAPGASGSEVSVSGSTVAYAQNEHGQGQNDFGLYVFEDGGITLNVTDSTSGVASTGGSAQKIVVNNRYQGDTYSPNKVTFTGGEIRLDNSGNTYFESGTAPEGSTLTVGVGTKLNFPLESKYLAEGSSVSADGTVVAEAPGATVVQADGTAYSATTLRDALIIAQDGATVTMLQGYTSATSLVVGKAITLDLNGQTITNNGGNFALALTGDGSVLRDSVGGGKIVAEGAAALVLQPLNTTGYQGANLNFTVSNVTLQSSNSGVALNIWYSNVTLEKVTVTSAGRNDGTINGVQVVNNSDVTFKDSTIDVTVNYVHPENELSGTAILVSDNAKVTLDGTTVNAKNNNMADGVPAQTSALFVQQGSDAVVKNSTVTSTDNGIAIRGKHFSMDKENHDEVMEQILAIKQEDYARLDIIDSTITCYGMAVNGNGEMHGTLINIEGSKIAVTGEAPAIYHPQYGVLNVGDGTEITGYTGVEMRAGTFNMTGGKIVATGEYEGGNNGNGSTMSGVALALSQHTTNLPLAANISGGELTATSEKGKALMEHDFEADSTGTDGEKAIAITNGTFNGAVESQSVTNYAAGGKFSVLPAENAFIEGFEGMLYDGYYVPVEKTTSDVGALLTAQAQALTSVRTYVASVLNLTLAEVEAMDLPQAQALVAAIEQINNAQSVSAVAVATNNALNAADELKAALDAAAAEEAEQLAQAKTQFVTELNALAAGDETNAPVVVPTSTLAAIANAKTYEEAKAYYDNAVAEINDVRTFRAEVAAQTATLGELKEYLTQVGDALNAFGGADGTFEKAIAEVNQAIADAQSAMLTAGAEALDDVKTALESKIDQVNVTLQNAVNSLALELATVRQDVADAAAATDGKLDDVIAAVEAAQAAISGGEATISQVAAAVQEVSNALDGAISELNTAIADVNNKLNAYNSTLNSLTGSLTTVGNELRNDVAEIAADLAVLADRIDGAATSDSVTDVASAVSKIASAIAALQQDVDSIANQVSASEAVETQKATAKTEILTWLNDYVDGITGGATAKASVGRLFMATANAATASDQSDLYTKLEGAFGADNARLVLKYYNEALNAIDSALTVSDVTTAVSTFKAQVASVEAASGNATDLTVVYVLLAVAVVLVIVLLIMVAARKSDKGEAAATAEEPARQTEEAQPEAQPVAQPVEEQPKQPEPQEAPEDDDREQVVISANVRTFEEALDELEEDPRKLFDDVLNYALTKPDAVKVQRSNGLVVKQNGKQIVKLTVKRGNPVALFVLENDLLKDFRRNSDTPVKLKVRATEFVLRSEEDLPTAHMMVDLAVDQIQKDVEAAKERRKAARRAKRQAAAEEAAAAEAPASEE